MPRRSDLLFRSVTLLAAMLLASPAAAGTSGGDDDVRLSFEAETFWLDRSDPGGLTLSAIEDFAAPDGGREILSTGDLGFDRELGGRATFGVHIGRDSIEFTYLRVHQWTASEEKTDALGRIDSFFSNETVQLGLPAGLVDPTDGFTDATSQRISYATELDGVELNYRRRLATALGLHTSVLAGLRYLRIDENFRFLSRNDQDSGRYAIGTENDLYGLQIGGTAHRALSFLRLGAHVKGGIFANRIRQDSEVRVNDGGVLYTFGTERTGTAFGTLLEAGLELALDLPYGVSLVAGYDVLRASGLALAPDQIAGKCCFGVLDILARDGSALYHGPRIGLEIALGGRPTSLAAGSVPGAPIALEPAGGTAGETDPGQGDIRLSFRAEAVWLQRDDPDGSVLTVADNANDCDGSEDGCELLGVEDLHFPLEGAGRWTIGLAQGRNAVELVYLGLADWSDTQALLADAVDDPDSILEDVSVLLPNGNQSNDPFDNAFGGVRVSYGTRLDSAELNYRRRLPPWHGLTPTFLAGLRYVGIEETFRFRVEERPTDDDNGVYAIDTDNHLYGAQLGIEVLRAFEMGPGALRIGLRAKGSLLANDVHQDSSVFVDPFQVVDAGESGIALANVVEAGLVLEIDLPFGLRLVGGYDAMRIGGLALAPDQISPTFARDGFGDLDTEGSAFYHGPWVGARIAFNTANPFD